MLILKKKRKKTSANKENVEIFVFIKRAYFLNPIACPNLINWRCDPRVRFLGNTNYLKRCYHSGKREPIPRVTSVERLMKCDGIIIIDDMSIMGKIDELKNFQKEITRCKAVHWVLKITKFDLLHTRKQTEIISILNAMQVESMDLTGETKFSQFDQFPILPYLLQLVYDRVPMRRHFVFVTDDKELREAVLSYQILGVNLQQLYVFLKTLDMKKEFNVQQIFTVKN